MATLTLSNRPGRLAALAMAAALGLAALLPGTARADDDIVRVLVEAGDVVFRGGHPYYRHGDHGYDDRLVVAYDRYGRPIYYRSVPRTYYRNGPPYGNAHGYWNNRPDAHRRVTCDRHGRCVSRYYDPRYDRRRHDGSRYRYDPHPYRSRYGYQSRYRDRYGYWDGYRWRTDND